MGAKIANPRKQFQFQVSIPGLEPFLCQRVTLPQIEIDQTTHGDTNYDVKTGGRKMVGNMTISKLQHANKSDSFWRNWSRDVQNTVTGGGLLPSQYKKTIIVEEYSSDGVTVIDRHVYVGCWPQRLNGKELNRQGSENNIEEIEISVDDEEI
jgi:hypothetical protein